MSEREEPVGARRIIPHSEYLRLCEAAEELEDIALAADVAECLADGRSLYVDIDGNPVVVAENRAR